MLKVMKNKEIRIILKDIENQFDCGIKGEYLFLKNPNKPRVYITSPNYKEIPKESLRINNTGLYFGTIEKGGFRLSIEGSELLDKPKKNVFELSDEEFEAYMAGENLRVDLEEKAYKIIKYKNKFIGSGKLSNNTLFNYVPKQRRAKEKL
jgi:NOL1/NOP2/fmu family ribosome biogenesis protein